MAWLNREDNERALRLMQEMGWARRNLYHRLLQEASEFEAVAEEREKLIVTMLQEGKNLLNLSGKERRQKVKEARAEIDRLLKATEEQRAKIRELMEAQKMEQEEKQETEPMEEPAKS